MEYDLVDIFANSEVDSESALSKLSGWITYYAALPEHHDQLQKDIDWIDKTLLKIDPATVGYSRSLRQFRSLCRTCQLLPTSCYLRGDLDVRLDGMYPQHQTALSDVYRGKCGRFAVAVKCLRLCKEDRTRVEQSFRDEVLMWRFLRHPNIVPFLGISSTHPVGLVSEWMPHGNIVEFLKTRQDENRVGYLKDVAAGLAYMHSLKVIHGDIKGGNILINDSCQACLTDFGVSTIIANTVTVTSTISMAAKGTVRWMAPEIVAASSEENDGRPTMASDIYSLSMVFWEILTGKVPFHDVRLDTTVAVKVMGGERPRWPPDPSQSEQDKAIWSLMESCWAQNPTLRPTAQEVVGSIAESPQAVSSVETKASLLQEGSALYEDTTNSAILRMIPLQERIRPRARLVSPPEPSMRPDRPRTTDPPDGPRGGPAKRRRAPASQVILSWTTAPRVLVVDDDVVDRRVTGRFVQVAGCVSDMAADGAAAVDMMRREQYDLVLMDIMMPELDGVSATSLVRQFDQRTPIIAMTSAHEPGDIMKYYSHGMNDILPKPFSREDLITMLDKHLAHLKSGENGAFPTSGHETATTKPNTPIGTAERVLTLAETAEILELEADEASILLHAGDDDTPRAPDDGPVWPPLEGPRMLSPSTGSARSAPETRDAPEQYLRSVRARAHVYADLADGRAWRDAAPRARRRGAAEVATGTGLRQVTALETEAKAGLSAGNHARRPLLRSPAPLASANGRDKATASRRFSGILSSILKITITRKKKKQKTEMVQV